MKKIILGISLLASFATLVSAEEITISREAAEVVVGSMIDTMQRTQPNEHGGYTVRGREYDRGDREVEREREREVERDYDHDDWR